MMDLSGCKALEKGIGSGLKESMQRIISDGILILFVGAYGILWFGEFIRQLRENGEKAEPKEVAIIQNGEWIQNGKKLARIFGLALLFRACVFLCGLLFYCMHAEGTQLSLSAIAAYWCRWDGPHYLDVAKYGYANCVENGQHLFLVFFPLYPWLIRLMALGCGDYTVAALLVSVLSYAVGAAFFYLVIAREYEEDIAEKSLVLLSVSPVAFFFGTVMSESLFFCLLSVSFYLIKRHRWFLAGFVGVLCALCRAQGVIILGVGAVEFLLTYSPVWYFRQKRMKDFWRAVFTKAIFLFLTPIGLGIYLWINYLVEGNCFQFVIYQRDHWHLAPTFFTNTLREISSYLFRSDVSLTQKACMWLPECLLFFLAFAALYYGRKRHPLKYTAFLFVYTMINFSVTWLISGSRYMLCALPLYVIGGEFLHRHPKQYPFVIAVSSMLMAIYMGGFFLWKSVM